MNTEFISLKSVIDGIKFHPLLKDVPIDMIIKYTLELIEIVGCPGLFEPKEADLEVENYRAMLPCDYYDMTQVVLMNNNRPSVAFKYSTATFTPMTYKQTTDLNYKVQGRIIYTSLEKCNIKIAYKAIKLDEEGYPMLINNAAFIRALESYVKMKWFIIQYDLGKITKQVKDDAQTDYYGDVKVAEGSLMTPTIDQMESLKNIFTSMLDKPFGHVTTFKEINKDVQLQIH